MPVLSMAPLYVKAALPRLGERPAAAPDVRLRREGVRPTAREVAAYAEVVGQPPSERLPLLYPHLLGFGLQLQIMTSASFPFPALGLVHVTNEVTVTRPLLLGETLDVEVQAAGVRPHPRGRVVDLLTTVRSDGDPVWHETSTYLRRERPAGELVPPSPHGTPEGEDDPATALHFSARWRLPANLGRSYAGVSGDVNPIHLSAWTARPLGFPQAIAHGMWTAAAVLAAMDGRLPGAASYTVQFRRPIMLPSTVRLFTAAADQGMDAEVRGREGDDRVHLRASVRAR